MSLSFIPSREPSLALRLAALVGCFLLVASATVAGLVLADSWGTAPVVLLYLLPVLVAAVYLGLWPALLTGAASTLAFNYYFTAPYHTLRIHSPADLVTVIALLVVGIVTSQLAGSLRTYARAASAHAARNATIAGLARRLLSCASEADIAEVATGELARLFGCHAVLLVAGDGQPGVLGAEPAGMTLSPSDLAAAAQALAAGLPTGRGIGKVAIADWQFHPVLSAERAIAVVGLARENGSRPVPEDELALSSNLLDQVALALERARLDQEARRMDALKERDRLRSVLLTSLGDDVKPRLAAIAAAVRGLRRSGHIEPDLVSAIASETTALDRYVDNLVDLDPGTVAEPIAVRDLVIDLHRRTVTKGGSEVHLTPKEYAVLAELAKHAGKVLTHHQLLRSVWGPAQKEQVDYLRVAVRALRQKLEDDPAEPKLIVNEPAIGYRLLAA